jgi:hypothetical protein
VILYTNFSTCYLAPVLSQELLLLLWKGVSHNPQCNGINYIWLLSLETWGSVKRLSNITTLISDRIIAEIQVFFITKINTGKKLEHSDLGTSFLTTYLSNMRYVTSPFFFFTDIYTEEYELDAP